MAAVLQLTSSSGTLTADLLSTALTLRQGAFNTRGPQIEGEFKPQGMATTFVPHNYERVTETWELVKRDTAANLRAAVYAVERLLEQARRWHEDALLAEACWLQWNVDGEESRRSLVYHGTLSYAGGVANPMLDSGALAARLQLIRHPLWEDAASDSYSTPTLSCHGGKWPLTADVTSTAPQRIAAFTLNGVSGSGPLARVWAGIRRSTGNDANFQSVWECELGTLTAGDPTHKDTALGSESGASPVGSSNNNKAVTTFATTPTLAKRATISVANVTANYSDQVGSYLLLLRCKVDSGTAVSVQARVGATGMTDADHAPNEAAYATATDWRLLPVGNLQIPPAGWRYERRLYDSIQATQIQLWAERLSGAGSLHLDCLLLIPTLHQVAFEGAAIQYGSPSLLYPAVVYTDENDVQTILAYLAATAPSASLKPLTLKNWYLPLYGGLLVLAAERSANHVLTDQVYPVLTVYPRWLSYRGV